MKLLSNARFNRIRNILKILTAMLFLTFLFVEGLILSGFNEQAPEGLDYIIVLGTQVLESGPNKDLQFRLDTAGKYLKQNPDTIAIVSGGQGMNEPISEAQAMYEYLVEYGIDLKRIKKEAQSTSTVENFQFSYKLIENPKNSVGIVTSNFHVFRSMKLAKAQGFQEIYGIASSSDRQALPKNMLREFVVVIKDTVVGNFS